MNGNKPCATDIAELRIILVITENLPCIIKSGIRDRMKAANGSAIIVPTTVVIVIRYFV